MDGLIAESDVFKTILGWESFHWVFNRQESDTPFYSTLRWRG